MGGEGGVNVNERCDDGCISPEKRERAQLLWTLLCAACISSVSCLLTEVNYGTLALLAQHAAADCTYTAVHSVAHAALLTLFSLCEGRKPTGAEGSALFYVIGLKTIHILNCYHEVFIEKCSLPLKELLQRWWNRPSYTH